MSKFEICDSTGVQLQVQTGTPLLWPSNVTEQILLTGDTITHVGKLVKFQLSEDSVFCFSSIPDDINLPIQVIAEQVYTEIFSIMKMHGMKYIWRAWNLVPNINGQYLDFNAGRLTAFTDENYLARSVAPAACGVGSDSDKLFIGVLAGKQQPSEVNNYRQTDAYNYPEVYGKSPPLFSRGALVDNKLFISGTASIVGHDSVHYGDVVKQTHESILNLNAVLDTANNLSQNEITNYDLVYKVYVRNVEDLQTIKDIVSIYFPEVDTIYVRSDICRSELLVEIEATSKNVIRYSFV